MLRVFNLVNKKKKGKWELLYIIMISVIKLSFGNDLPFLFYDKIMR